MPSETRRAEPYETTLLPNGLTVVCRSMPHCASVAVGMWVKAGGRYEPLARAGLSHFLEHLLFKGTRRRSCEQIKQGIEGVGGTLNGFTAEEFTCYLAKVPRRHMRRAIDILSDMILRPSCSPKDIEKEREVILEEIRMYEDLPAQSVHDLFHQLLWPNHPLGMLLSGTEETVRRIRRTDLIAYQKRMYQPRQLIVACAGALDPPKVLASLRASFARATSHRIRRFLPAPRRLRTPQVRLRRKETEQTHLCLGTYAMPRSHPDRFALEVLHVLLGANMSSRLFHEVRERRGLVYEIGTQVKRYYDTGAFVIHAGCDANKLTLTLKTVTEELGRLKRIPVSRLELARAKEYYTGQLVMGLEDPMDHMLWMGEQAVAVGRIAIPEKVLEGIRRVKRSDLLRVARILFRRGNLHLAVVGPVPETDVTTWARTLEL